MFWSQSQQHRSAQFGFKIGLVCHFGTHQNVIGISLNSYYQQYFYQINANTQLTYRLTDYGNRKFFWESRSCLGGLLLGGKNRGFSDFEFGEGWQNSSYKNGIGYAYIWYFDNKSTSQRSGMWALHLSPISVLFENDVFGGQAKDRFRTGAIQFSYLQENFKINAGINIWTGETKGSKWIKDKTKYGYRDLSSLPYGKTSHGIFKLGISYPLPYQQTGNFQVGLDDEQIRHFIQNRLSHDLLLFPKKFPRNTPNYPRLDDEGMPIFTKKERKATQPYFSIGLNQNWSY